MMGLKKKGIKTGIDVKRLAAISRHVMALFQKPAAGKMYGLVAREDIKLLLGSGSTR